MTEESLKKGQNASEQREETLLAPVVNPCSGGVCVCVCYRSSSEKNAPFVINIKLSMCSRDRTDIRWSEKQQSTLCQQMVFN